MTRQFLTTGIISLKKEFDLHTLISLLNHMPKPVVHHVHTTAAVPISYLVKTITYFDFVYYSMKEAKYQVTKDPSKVHPGFI